MGISLPPRPPVGKDTQKGALEDCVARKIPKLMNEGHEQQQAIAIAYSMCSGKAWEELDTDLQQRVLDAYAKSWRTGHDCPQCSTVIKRLDGQPDRVGGYGVVWGDPDHRDLEGEYFNSQSNFFLPERTLHFGEAVKGLSIPWIYNHAMGDLPPAWAKNDDARDYTIGVIDTAIPDDVGLWLEAQISDHNEWAKYVLDLVDREILHWSTGTASHLAKRAPDGWIKSWPIVEGSSTPSPAEPRHTQNVVLKHYVTEQLDTSHPTGRASEGAVRRAGTADSLSTLNGGTTMGLTINAVTAKAIWSAYMDTNFDSMQASFEAITKQGGDTSNLLADALRPLAEELAPMAGQSIEDALAYLVQYVAEKVTTGPAPEEPPAPEGMPEGMSTQIETAVEKALAKRLPTVPTGQYLTPQQKNVQVTGKAAKPLTLARYIWAVKNHRWDILEDAKPRIEAGYKALGITPDTAGGYLVPVEHSTQVIELLSPGSKVLALCKQWPMNSDIVDVPKLTSGSAGTWLGENAQLTGTDPAFGNIRLTARKYGTLLKISNELLESSDPSVDALIRQDIARDIAEALDAAILEGTGIGGQPLGLANHPDVTKTALNAAPTVANIMTVINGIESANVYENPAWQWVMNPRDKLVLAGLRDTTSGDYLWTEMGLPGYTMVGGYPATLRGYPYKSTTKVSINTADNNETRLYFGQWDDVIVGMRKTLELKASDQAGTSFEYDQTWIRGIVRVDVNIRHAESIRILTDVRAS